MHKNKNNYLVYIFVKNCFLFYNIVFILNVYITLVSDFKCKINHSVRVIFVYELIYTAYIWKTRPSMVFFEQILIIVS